MNLAALSSGLLMEGDHVSLSAGLHVSRLKLIDDATGARHGLSRQAAAMLQGLFGAPEASTWCKAARNYGIADDQVAEVIDFLQHIGGLRVRRTIAGRLLAIQWHVAGLLHGATPLWRARRWPANARGVASGVSRLVAPLLVLVVLVDYLAGGATTPTRHMMSYTAVFCIAFWASAVAHELVHVRIICHYSSQAAVAQRGLRVGILHKPLPVKRELCSAILGPISGGAVALVLCSVAGIALHFHQLITLGLLMFALHMLSLLPTYGDGSVLWKVLLR